MHKRGFTSFMLIGYSVIAFISVMFLGMFIYGLGLVDGALSSLDFELGPNITFNGVYNDTLKQGIDAITDQADNMGVMLILGMVLVMILIGYFVGEEYKRLWIALDIVIIVVAFIAAIYIRVYFNDYVNANIIPLEIYADQLPQSSTLINKIPFMIPVIGGILILVTYVFRKEPEAFENRGY